MGLIKRPDGTTDPVEVCIGKSEAQLLLIDVEPFYARDEVIIGEVS